MTLSFDVAKSLRWPSTLENRPHSAEADDLKVQGVVCVLLATHNGAPWLEEQVESIENQFEVVTCLIVNDDASTDGTPLLLQSLSAAGRAQLLPRSTQRLGSANRNFVRLIVEADIGDAAFVALSDQDDVWLPEKLSRATGLLRAHGLDAVSSDVTAFWPDGRTRFLRKSQPMRRFDYLFESAGPGCTFVFSRCAFDELREWMRRHRGAVDRVKVHDWLIYAHARQQGWKWHIDDQPLMRYRQHQHNEIGANDGYRAIRLRLSRAVSGTFRLDCLAIAEVVSDTSWVTVALRRFRFTDRLRLVLGARQLRRRPRDFIVLALLFLTMRRLDETR